MGWTFDGGRPLYTQLVEQLKAKIVSGEYPPGQRIPPVRELAAEAGVNPNTLQRAFSELEREARWPVNWQTNTLTKPDSWGIPTSRRSN